MPRNSSDVTESPRQEVLTQVRLANARQQRLGHGATHKISSGTVGERASAATARPHGTARAGCPGLCATSPGVGQCDAIENDYSTRAEGST